jgi:hypothetical protein
VDVGEQRGTSAMAEQAQRRRPVLRGIGREAEQCQLSHQHVAVHRVIVHDQHARAQHGNGGARRGLARRALHHAAPSISAWWSCRPG